MELSNSNSNNGGTENPSHCGADGTCRQGDPDVEDTDVDSSCSTPYYSAPSSPGRSHPGYYYSAPTSPMHFALSSYPVVTSSFDYSDDFEFSARFSNHAGAQTAGSMSSADELFLNGQIRPMKLSSHLQRPQLLAPLLDLGVEEEDEAEKEAKRWEGEARGRDSRLRSRSLHRRARSLSPFRNPPMQWTDDGEGEEIEKDRAGSGVDTDLKEEGDEMQTAASSRSNSSSLSGRNAGKRWIFLKDLLYRSKSEGRNNGKEKEKFWQSISFSPSKDKSLIFFSRDKSKDTAVPESKKKKHRNHETTISLPSKKATVSSSSKPTNGVEKRRMPARSAHEKHYTTNRAQAEEMRKRTFLPYRQGLLGCLGFSSRGYGAMNGLARTLNTVSSR